MHTIKKCCIGKHTPCIWQIAEYLCVIRCFNQFPVGWCSRSIFFQAATVYRIPLNRKTTSMLPCYAMLCHAMPCYAMLCHAMPCYAGVTIHHISQPPKRKMKKSTGEVQRNQQESMLVLIMLWYSSSLAWINVPVAKQKIHQLGPLLGFNWSIIEHVGKMRCEKAICICCIYGKSCSISLRTTQSPIPSRIRSIIQCLANPTIPTTPNQPTPVEEIFPTTANPTRKNVVDPWCLMNGFSNVGAHVIHQAV